MPVRPNFNSFHNNVTTVSTSNFLGTNETTQNTVQVPSPSNKNQPYELAEVDYVKYVTKQINLDEVKTDKYNVYPLNENGSLFINRNLDLSNTRDLISLYTVKPKNSRFRTIVNIEFEEFLIPSGSVLRRDFNATTFPGVLSDLQAVDVEGGTVPNPPVDPNIGGNIPFSQTVHSGTGNVGSVNGTGGAPPPLPPDNGSNTIVVHGPQ